MPNSKIINIVIADDHEMFRDGIKLLLSRIAHFNLVGEAVNGQNLIDIVSHVRPDIVLTDIKMPEKDGIEATRELSVAFPNIGIIGLSMFDEDELIIDMLEAGAKGFLVKNSNKEQIIDAIQTVATGEPFYCSSTNKKLTRLIANSQFNPYRQKEKVEFNEREIQIIQLLADEKTNKEIAETVFLSVRTIEGLRLKLLERANVKNSVGLVIYAYKRGLIKL
jgi:DNA-binding NarL/FixJ family response regulator